ncbi:MAG: TRAP transporter large permease [Synergistaceae bacterium]|jgi:tripartite ATP-independent transporter DctM subunit|nr:TRAP transporter large permease [Synergistaceae bacterium]
MTPVYIFLGTLAVTLPLGIPIGFALFVCAYVLMIYLGSSGNLNLLAQSMIAGTNNFSLMAIPFFMLAGEVMSKGGLSRRIVDFANLTIGRIRGGLGYAAVLASMIFAGLSGSAVADAAALGGILIPLMRQNGYNTDRSTGLVCAGSVIAPIIPPSIPMIVLGAAVTQSVGKMFMAGIFPGILLGIALMATWKIYVKKDGYNDTRTYTKEEARRILKDSIPALIMPVIIVGGIRGGIFTPTEAGAFAVVYALLIALLLYKELDFRGLVEVCVDATKSTGVVMFVVAAAMAAGWLVTMAQIPAKFVVLLSPLVKRPLILMLTINVFLLVMGMVMDLTPNLLIFGPILFPVIIAAGIDPTYFGVIMVLNLTIGLITPPVGTVLYLGCGISNIRLPEVVKGVMPFLIAEIIMLLLFIFVPQLVTFPLKLFY